LWLAAAHSIDGKIYALRLRCTSAAASRLISEEALRMAGPADWIVKDLIRAEGSITVDATISAAPIWLL